MSIESKTTLSPVIALRSSPEFDSAFLRYAMPIIKQAMLEEAENYLQHGMTSCYSHSISVAYYSLMFADRIGITLDMKSLVIGALLHDYFLYDWHEKDSSHRLHGFKHPKVALTNAMRNFDLNPVEQNIILRHMFPLTPIPPKYRESLIVCFVDKLCSLAETLKFDISPLTDNPDLWQSHNIGE